MIPTKNIQSVPGFTPRKIPSGGRRRRFMRPTGSPQLTPKISHRARGRLFLFLRDFRNLLSDRSTRSVRNSVRDATPRDDGVIIKLPGAHASRRCVRDGVVADEAISFLPLVSFLPLRRLTTVHRRNPCVEVTFSKSEILQTMCRVIARKEGRKEGRSRAGNWPHLRRRLDRLVA